MVTVRINEGTRKLAEADAQWITQQINGRRRDQQLVCVAVLIDEPRIQLHPATPTCGGRRIISGRRLTREEEMVFALWERYGLNSHHFSGGQVNAFLEQLRRLV